MRDRSHICNRVSAASTSIPTFILYALKKRDRIAIRATKAIVALHVIAEVRIEVAKAKGHGGEKDARGCDNLSWARERISKIFVKSPDQIIFRQKYVTFLYINKQCANTRCACFAFGNRKTRAYWCKKKKIVPVSSVPQCNVAMQRKLDATFCINIQNILRFHCSEWCSQLNARVLCVGGMLREISSTTGNTRTNICCDILEIASRSFRGHEPRTRVYTPEHVHMCKQGM